MSKRKKRSSKSKTESSTNSAQTHSESPIPAQESTFPPQLHTSQETIQELLLEEPSQTPTVDEVLGHTHTPERKRSSPGIPTGVFFKSLNTILYDSPSPFAAPRASLPSHPEDASPKPDSPLTMAGAGDSSPPPTARKPSRPNTPAIARKLSSQPGTTGAPETARKPPQPKTPGTAQKPSTRPGTPGASEASRKPSTKVKTPTTAPKPSSRPGIPGAGAKTPKAIPPTPKQPLTPKPPPPTPKTPAVEVAKKPAATTKAPKKAAARSKTGKAKPGTAGLLDSNIIAAPTGTTGRTTRSAAGTLPKKPERLVNAVTAPAAEKKERKSKPGPIKVVKPSSNAGKRSGPSPYQTGSTPGRKGSLQTSGKNVKFMTDDGIKIPGRGRGSVSGQENSNSSVRSRPKTPFAREVASPGGKRPQDEKGTGHDVGENMIYCPFPESPTPSEIEKEEQARKNKEMRAKEKAAVKPWEWCGTGKVLPKRAREEGGIQGQGQGQGPNKKRKRGGKKHRGGKGKGKAKGGAGNKT